MMQTNTKPVYMQQSDCSLACVELLTSRPGHSIEGISMLQVFQTACRQGHFRLTVHSSNDSSSVEFGMHAFTVGAAVISLMRWLSELRDRLPKDGPAMLRQQVR